MIGTKITGVKSPADQPDLGPTKRDRLGPDQIEPRVIFLGLLDQLQEVLTGYRQHMARGEDQMFNSHFKKSQLEKTHKKHFPIII